MSSVGFNFKGLDKDNIPRKEDVMVSISHGVLLLRYDLGRHQEWLGCRHLGLRPCQHTGTSSSSSSRQGKPTVLKIVEILQGAVLGSLLMRPLLCNNWCRRFGFCIAGHLVVLSATGHGDVEVIQLRIEVLSHTIERYHSSRNTPGESKTIFRCISCIVIIGLTTSGRKAWQEEEEETRKDTSIVLIHQE